MNILMILANPFTHDSRVYNEAKSLVKAGHEVTVLAWDKKREHPLKDKKNGITIVRSHNTKFMDLLPFDIFRLHFWWKKGYKDALKICKEDPFDVIHCHDLSALPIGAKLKKKLGVRVMFDAHEIFGYMVAKDLPHCWANYYLWLEKRLIRCVDRIIVAEDRYADYFHTITNKKLTPLLNCKHLFSKEYMHPDNQRFTLLYIGTLNPARYIYELADVVQEIEGVECIIGGIGKPKFVETLKQKCYETENVKFIGKVPPENVVDMTQKSDVVVCMINPNVINNKIATANKQFEAMVCGRPIICTKGTRSGEITEKENCGLVVDYTKEALRKAIIKLRDSPDLCEEFGRNALNAAINKYNWGIEEKKLIGLYEKVKATK